MKEVFVTICSSAAVVHAQCNVAKHCVEARACSIEPKQLHSVKQKHIKPCDSSMISAKVYRALDEGILVCSMNREMEKKITPQGGGLCMCIF